MRSRAWLVVALAATLAFSSFVPFVDAARPASAPVGDARDGTLESGSPLGSPLVPDQADRLALAADLHDLARQDADEDSAVLDAAGLVLDHRADPDTAPPTQAPGMDALSANLGLVHEVTEDPTEPAEPTLSAGFDRAKTVAEVQAGSSVTASPPMPGIASLEAALTELADRHSVSLDSQQRDALDDRASSDERIRDAMERSVDAFLALEEATARQGNEADPRLGAVLEERGRFLDAVQHLHDVVDRRGGVEHATNAEGHLDACPAFALDLEGQDSVYTRDCALIVDVGGSDAYRNNAGGSGLGPNPCAGSHAAAALVDLGPANDTFGDPSDPRRCGANGGGHNGTGILISEGGDDTYIAGERGTNGGGHGAGGLGLLVDAGGNDTYTAASAGTNGGGNQGVGALVDVAGSDRYAATSTGTNGGATDGGSGTILDAAGDDVYQAGGSGANGGGWTQGTGRVLDLAGSDSFEAGSGATNGGGQVGGVGFLYHGGGDAVFEAGSTGANGGAINTGAGALIAADGRNEYIAEGSGTNGAGSLGGHGLLIDDDEGSTFAGGPGSNGGGYIGGIGSLVSLGGDETFTAERRAANGGGVDEGRGFLFSASGDDTYIAGPEGTNGGGWRTGVGLLVDGGGDDRYVAEHKGVNGGALLDGVGTLVDLDGDDRYTASHGGANGGASLATAGLFDAAGTDRYEDRLVPGGSCWDCSVPVKGSYGSQTDAGPETGGGGWR